MHEITNKVIAYIKNEPEYIDFCNKIINIPDIKLKHDVYNYENNNKYFVSIDIKSANFRVLKHYCPNIDGLNGEWSDFLEKFTKSKFLLHSKQFREMIFGNLGNKKLGTLPITFIDDVREVLTRHMFLISKTCCTTDEIIYHIHNIDSFRIDKFMEIVEKVHPGYFHIDVFKLVQIGNFPYFVKQYINSNKKNEFKGIPKKLIMQCIKYYSNKPIEEIDRKFTDDNGYIATYDNSIFDL